MQLCMCDTHNATTAATLAPQGACSSQLPILVRGPRGQSPPARQGKLCSSSALVSQPCYPAFGRVRQADRTRTGRSCPPAHSSQSACSSSQHHDNAASLTARARTMLSYNATTKRRFWGFTGSLIDMRQLIGAGGAAAGDLVGAPTNGRMLIGLEQRVRLGAPGRVCTAAAHAGSQLWRVGAGLSARSWQQCGAGWLGRVAHSRTAD